MSKRKVTPDVLADLMGREPKREEKATPKRKTSKSRLAGRATYDLSPELKEAIAERATRLGIPASQLAHFLLLHAWRQLEDGELDPEPFLEPSTSPAFRNNLDIEAATATEHVSERS